jgi:hypothetical protein
LLETRRLSPRIGNIILAIEIVAVGREILDCFAQTELRAVTSDFL